MKKKISAHSSWKLSLGSRVIFKGFVAAKRFAGIFEDLRDICQTVAFRRFRQFIHRSYGRARVPVIATPVGGIVDFLEDKRTGLFCAVSEPKDLAKKVLIYLRDINLRDEIIDNASKWSKKNMIGIWSRKI